MYMEKYLLSLAAWSHFFTFSTSCSQHTTTEHRASSFVRRAAPAAQVKTAITNVRVFDGSCFTPPKTIIFDQGLITSDPSNVVSTINATGQFLIPGLIDSHVHPSNVRALENLTSYGVTTTMSMSCQNYTTCALLKQQVGLSDYYTAGMPAIGPNSAHANNLPPSRLVTDASNATDLAHWAAKNGSDYFKITLETNGPSYNLTRRLVSAVHALGQQAMSHAGDLAAYMQAISTSIDGLQHAPQDGNMTSALVSQLAASGQFVTPTLSIFSLGLNPPNPTVLQFMRGSTDPGNASWAHVVHNVREMHRGGVPILAGTDAVGLIVRGVDLPFGKSLHDELGYLVQDVGMSPAEAIRAATSSAARYHRLCDRGTVANGMRADLVLLGSNPLERIANSRDIRAVWVAGRRYGGGLKAPV